VGGVVGVVISHWEEKHPDKLAEVFKGRELRGSEMGKAEISLHTK